MSRDREKMFAEVSAAAAAITAGLHNKIMDEIEKAFEPQDSNRFLACFAVGRNLAELAGSFMGATVTEDRDTAMVPVREFVEKYRQILEREMGK